MRYRIFVLFLAAGSVGCRRDPEPAPVTRAGGDERAGANEPDPVRGDRVVVEPRAAQFFEGRVLGASKGRLRIEPIGGGESVTVAPADVYRLPPRAKALTPLPELAVCRVRDHWKPCRVHGREGAALRVETPADGSVSVGADAILPPSPLTELNLKQYFAREAERADFARRAAQAGEPVRPAGYRVLPHARVVARRQSGWQSGVVVELDDGGAYVQFRSDGLKELVKESNIVPEAPAAVPPSRGDFVLARPESPAEPWRPARVVGVHEGEYKIASESGQERLVPLRDLLPLGRSEAP